MEAIDLLPDELKVKSLSRKEVILSYEDVIKAINNYSNNNWVVLNWEGWIKYSEGKHGHSRNYRGILDIIKEKSESWDSFVKRAAIHCISTIKQAQKLWHSKPEYPGAMLYFCITAVEKPASEEDIKEFEEHYYYCFSATLRIFGDEVPFEEISKTIGLIPTYTHRKGVPMHVNRPNRLWEHDMWSYEAPIQEEEPLDVHIEALWNKLKPHRDYLLKLKVSDKLYVT